MMFLLAPLPVILQITSVWFDENMQQKLMSKSPAKYLYILIRFKFSAILDQFQDSSNISL